MKRKTKMANNNSLARFILPTLIISGIAVGGLGVFGIGPAAGWLIGLTSDDSDDTLPGPQVKRGPLVISVIQRGNLSARNSDIVRNELEGRTTILTLVPEGSRVQAGDVIAELDVSSTEDRRVQQEIAVQNAEAAWVKAQQELEIQESQNFSDLERAKRNLRFAEDDLGKYLNGDYPQDLASANEAIALAKEELQQAQDTLKYSEGLYEEGFLTRTEYERDRLAAQRREIELDKANRALVLLNDYDRPRKEETFLADIEETKRELDRVGLQATARLVDYQANVKSSLARLELERSNLNKIVDQLSKATVRAPVDGLVVYARERSRWGSGDPIAEGTEVRERQELVTIPREGGMIVEASLHESVIKKVQAGQKASIRVDAIPGQTFTGTVDFVSLLPDSTNFWANPNQRLFETRILVDEATIEMRPGMSCEVEILVDSMIDVLQVPVQAVFRSGSRTVCFVDTQSGPEEVEVETGRDNDRWVEVKSGLTDGQTVLLSPPAGFKLEPPIAAGPPQGMPESTGNRSGDLSRPSNTSDPSNLNRTPGSDQKSTGSSGYPGSGGRPDGGGKK
ncbi:MAG: efflux RND transporter periplasmic adaptor subunit [Planctomycetes bacterium]|nr:efflux RND transporter periplasmic adaptor subunit [Planctomycetota bacterium]